ncbi:putative hemerythrin-like protein [Colletotrichum liriopes]|uniref:Hemerythrin-like protein n=1 Tax=Colletotrichum liriopes TaxID=708192 RepID=A0AA37GD16_9PEZI|nr:putative hemerythrin-like protein [Colletotrichum liriopes]
MGRLSDTNAQFLPTLESPVKDPRRHIKEEEEEDMVGGHGVELRADKTVYADTSHPSAPNKPPFETVVGLMTAPLDELMGMFIRFPMEEEQSKAKGKL